MDKSVDENLPSEKLIPVSVRSKEPVNEALIPGLPDNLGMVCLARISHGFLGKLECVCKRWRDVIPSEDYAFCKSRMGCCGDWLFVMAEGNENRWNAYDPHADRWHPIPQMPGVNGVKHFGFSCVSVGNRFLVIGGSLYEPYSKHGPIITNQVLSFDPFTQKWSKVASMLHPRASFACSVICGKVYVAGGNSFSRKNVNYSSAEVYDPVNNRWEKLPEMRALTPSARPTRCSGISYNNKFYVMEHKLSHMDDQTAEVFDPHVRRWCSQQEKWQKPTRLRPRIHVINDHLYIVKSRDEGDAILAFNSESRAWQKIGSVPGHPRPEKYFGYAFCSLRNTLYTISGSTKFCNVQISAEEYLNFSRAFKFCHLSTTPLQWREKRLVPSHFEHLIVAFASLEQVLH